MCDGPAGTVTTAGGATAGGAAGAGVLELLSDRATCALPAWLVHNRRARGLEDLNVADEMREAAHWCVSKGLASRVLSLRNDAAANLEYYDAHTHGVRLCFWDAYAQAVRPTRARTLHTAPNVATSHITRSSRSLVCRPSMRAPTAPARPTGCTRPTLSRAWGL